MSKPAKKPMTPEEVIQKYPKQVKQLLQSKRAVTREWVGDFVSLFQDLNDQKNIPSIISLALNEFVTAKLKELGIEVE